MPNATRFRGAIHPNLGRVLGPDALERLRRKGFLPPLAGAQDPDETSALEAIEELNTQIVTKSAAVEAKASTADELQVKASALVKKNATSDEAKAATDELNEAYDARDAEMKELEALKSQRSTLQRGIAATIPGKKDSTKRIGKAEGRGDLKSRMLGSDGFKSGLAEIEERGLAHATGSFGDVRMKGIVSPAELKAVLTGAPTFQTGVGPAIDGERLPTIFQDRRPVRLLDRITIRPTAKPMVYWASQVPRTNVAAVVAEAGTKPKSGFDLVPHQAAMETIAVLTDVSRQALDDVDYLQGEIEDLMRQDLVERIEEYLVNGNGAAGSLRGILNTTGVQSYSPAEAEDRLKTLAEGQNRLKDGFSFADTIALNHRDVTDFAIARDASGGSANTGQWLYSNPFDPGLPRLLGTGTVETPLVALGTYIEGDFRSIKFMPYGGVDVRISESNKDNFEINMVTIRVECRGQIVIDRPSRIVHGVFNDPAPEAG